MIEVGMSVVVTVVVIALPIVAGIMRLRDRKEAVVKSLMREREQVL